MSASSVVQAFALAFWSFQLAPQVYANYTAQSTAGLSSAMMMAWTLGSLCTAMANLGAHLGILFVLQPNLFIVFGLTCWAQHFYYHRSRQYGLLAGTLALLVLAGLEVLGALLLLDSPDNDGLSSWPLLLLNALSTAFFVLGFVPQYLEMYRTKSAVGISRLFLAIDMTGAVFSVAALILQPPFSGLAAGCYIAVFVLDGGIMTVSMLGPQTPAAITVLSSSEQTPDVCSQAVMELAPAVGPTFSKATRTE